MSEERIGAGTVAAAAGLRTGDRPVVRVLDERAARPTTAAGAGIAVAPVREVTIEVVDPADDDAQRCLRAYEAELNERFDGGFEVDSALPLPADELRPPSGCFLVAYRGGEAVGCGGLKLHGDDPAEIKRVWVDPAARGLGLARRLMRELEDRARARRAPQRWCSTPTER